MPRWDTRTSRPRLCLRQTGSRRRKGKAEGLTQVRLVHPCAPGRCDGAEAACRVGPRTIVYRPSSRDTAQSAMRHRGCVTRSMVTGRWRLPVAGVCGLIALPAWQPRRLPARLLTACNQQGGRVMANEEQKDPFHPYVQELQGQEGDIETKIKVLEKILDV